MKKTSSTELSGLKNNSPIAGQPAFVSTHWQHSQPAFADIPWQHGKPNLLSIPPSQWKQLMLQARNYDPRAIETFTTLALPIAEHYSSIPKVAAVLGKEEAYCIANQTMMNFLMQERLREETQDIPTMLKQAIRCDLMNQMDRIKNRRQFEIDSRSGANGQTEEEAEDDTDVIANLPGDKRLEPERQALQDEQKQLVQKCLHYLSAKEKKVILGIYFRQLSVEEIAAELHCSVNVVSTTKYRAFRKLRKLFTENNITF